MNKGTFSDFKDEIIDELESVGKIVKKQLTTKAVPAQQQALVDEKNKKDPVTGKPTPSKKMLTQLNQQVAQLSQMRLKKVREELEKQRLKVAQPASAKAPAGQAGPEIKLEEKKPDDIVVKTLKGSKSTGEFKGLIGG